METLNENAETGCCSRFEPEPWDEQEVTWDEKRFVKDRVRCFFHIPLNFGKVMVRNAEVIRSADATPPAAVVLCDENSLWGADVYIEASRDVPGARMATISGRFLTKVFEGPYKDVPKWYEQMRAFVESRGKEARRMYAYYTTCPKCAQAYGKNYVVIVAEV